MKKKKNPKKAPREQKEKKNPTKQTWQPKRKTLKVKSTCQESPRKPSRNYKNLTEDIINGVLDTKLGQFSKE